MGGQHRLWVFPPLEVGLCPSLKDGDFTFQQLLLSPGTGSQGAAMGETVIGLPPGNSKAGKETVSQSWVVGAQGGHASTKERSRTQTGGAGKVSHGMLTFHLRIWYMVVYSRSQINIFLD